MGSLARKTILIAEDEAFTRRVLLTTLTRMGAEVITCVDGQEALNKLSQPRRVDMVLLDVLMPNVHGLHVLKQIRAAETYQDYKIPVSLLTATTDEACVHFASGLSCDGFILKPVTQAALTDRLDRMLQQRLKLPYEPLHYRKIDVGPPDRPPSMPTAADRFMPTDAWGVGVEDLKVGMVVTAPIFAMGRVVVPPDTAVTQELLQLLLALTKRESLGVIQIAPDDVLCV